MAHTDVMEVVVPAAFDGERVDRVVATVWRLSRADAAALVDDQAVLLDGTAVGVRSRRVTAGQRLEVSLPERRGEPPAPAADPAIDVPIVATDESVIVVDKPAGLVVHPGAGHAGGTLVNGLLARFPEIAAVGDPARPGIVHRLDAGTSGLLLVARTPQAHESLVAQLAARTVDRRYLALAWGTFEHDAGVVDAPIGRSPRAPTLMAVTAGGRPARTHYQVLERFTGPAEVTLVECRLETGRTHQVRVHLAAIGHPVVGDDRYRGQRPPLPTDRPFLHAHRLGFDHPVGGHRCHYESDLPPDLKDLRGRLV